MSEHRGHRGLERGILCSLLKPTCHPCINHVTDHLSEEKRLIEINKYFDKSHDNFRINFCFLLMHSSKAFSPSPPLVMFAVKFTHTVKAMIYWINRFSTIIAIRILSETHFLHKR